MAAPSRDHLKRFNNIALALVLVFGIMYIAGDFLKPLIFAALVATLMAPFCRWMERKGLSRGLAATFSAATVFLVIGVLLTFLAWQVRSFKDDLPELKEKLLSHAGTGQHYLQENFGVTIEDAPEADSTALEDLDTTMVDEGGDETIVPAGSDEESSEGGENNGNKDDNGNTIIPMSQAFNHLLTFLKVSVGTLFTIMIIFAYIVLFLYYRKRLTEAVIMIFPEERKERTKHALKESGKVGQGYLGGMFIVATILGILNSIALFAIGIEHPFLFGFLAGYLNFIPFVGTMIGSLLPITMALLTESTFVPALLVALAFMFNQVLEETLLTPKIVGDRVNVNPLFIIFAIVIGNLIWGIVGVILFIPLMAIAKIIFDHVEELKPLAHFLGQQEDEEPTLFRKLQKKIKGLFG